MVNAPFIMVSHASANLDIAEALADALEAENLNVWLASRDIPIGSNFAEEISRTISAADFLIVLLSPEAISSPHVKREVNLAISLGKKLLPVLHDDGSGIMNNLPHDWNYWLSLAQVVPLTDMKATALRIATTIRRDLPRMTPPSTPEKVVPADAVTPVAIRNENFHPDRSQALALAIASCEEVCVALDNGNHPCHSVVKWQAEKWEPKVNAVQGSKMHRPEPWTGDLASAPIIFLASNPSFGPDENFPSWEGKWTEAMIADFGSHRFRNSFAEGYGASDGPTFQQADRYLDLHGEFSRNSVSHWQWVRRFASFVLDKDLDEVSAHSDYVMTELVHCKSPHEEGVNRAMGRCKDKWFDQIMAVSPAKLIFVAGVVAGKDFVDLYKKQIPSTWGSWSDSKSTKGKGSWPTKEQELQSMTASGQWSLDQQKLNSVDLEIAGMVRTVIYIARPGGGGLCTPWNHPDLIHPQLLDYWRSKT
jgi:hypothetical protein